MCSEIYENKQRVIWVENAHIHTLWETGLSTFFFLVRILPYSVGIRENTDQKKLCIWTLFA